MVKGWLAFFMVPSRGTAPNKYMGQSQNPPNRKYCFLISFITSFSPKRFMQALRNSTFVWAPSVGTTELCTNFFNAQIECFGGKRCDE